METVIYKLILNLLGNKTQLQALVKVKFNLKIFYSFFKINFYLNKKDLGQIFQNIDAKQLDNFSFGKNISIHHRI